MRIQVQSLASVSGSGIYSGRGVGHRLSSDPALLWLWYRSTTVAPIQPLAWELPYAAGTALKGKKIYTYILYIHFWGEFPVGLVVRTWCFHCCGPDSIPGLGTKIPYQAAALRPKKKRHIVFLLVLFNKLT